jgi:hypothetical protein
MFQTAIKIILAVSLVANAALVVVAWQYRADYETLLTWVCDAGNGGYECGEE